MNIINAFSIFCLTLACCCGAESATNRVDLTPKLRFELWKDMGEYASFTNRMYANDKIYYTLTNISTQALVCALLPRDNTFIFAMYDMAGNELKKTSLGLSNSHSVDIGAGADKLKIKHHTLSIGGAYINEAFKPEDYFIIRSNGIYLLETKIRVWTEKTNGQYGLVVSPPTRLEIEKR